MGNNKLKKYLFTITGLIGIIALIKLFSFSSSELGDDTSYYSNFNSNYKVFSLNIPENLNFSNEKVPISDFDVRERMDRELLVNTYWQSHTLLLHKRASKWFPVIEPILKKNGIPDDFKYLAMIESGLTNVVSPAGATGYWQLLETTALGYGLEINEEIDERYHIEKSTEVACKYLRDAYKQFGSWTLAAAAYNLGINGISKQIEKQKVTSYYDLLLNEETSRYLFRILALKEIISSPKKYGFHLRKKDLYPTVPTKQIKIDTEIKDLAVFAIDHQVNYKVLKILNPWLRQNSIANPSNKEYIISLPKDNTNEFYDHFLLEYDNKQVYQKDTLHTSNTPLDSLNKKEATTK